MANFSSKCAKIKKIKLFEKRDKVCSILLKPKHIKQAGDTLMTLMQGKHPGDPDTLINPDLSYKASKLVYDTMISEKTKVNQTIEYSHQFTEIPLEQVVVSDADIVDVTPVPEEKSG